MPQQRVQYEKPRYLLYVINAEERTELAKNTAIEPLYRLVHLFDPAKKYLVWDSITKREVLEPPNPDTPPPKKPAKTPVAKKPKSKPKRKKQARKRA